MSWGSCDQGPQRRDQKKQSLPSSSLEAGSPKSRCQHGCREISFLVSSSFWRLWCHLACSHIPPLYASVSSWPLPGLFLTNFSLLTRKPDTLHWGPRCPKTTFSLFMAAKPAFPSKVTFTDSGWTCVLGPPFTLSLMDQW